MKYYHYLLLFILVYKICDNIVLSTVISISLSSFYKTFINKKEGMEDHHEIINQTRSQHLGISTNNTASDTDNNTSSDNNNTTSDNNNTSSDTDNNTSSDTDNNTASGSYEDMLEDSDESAVSTYNNTITNVDDSSYSCKAHNNSSPTAVALCDAGHQKVSTNICSTGCAASQKINGFYVCCVGECGSCGTDTITDNRGYTGGATSSYYKQSDTDGDGEDETTHITRRWDLGQRLRSRPLALQDISDNQDGTPFT